MRCCSVLLLIFLLVKEKFIHGWLQGRIFKSYLASKSIGFERRLDVNSMSNVVVQSRLQINDSYDETELLAAAKSCLDHLEECEFNREWNGYLLKCKSASSLTEGDKDSLYKIFEVNMKELYEANWGWKEIEKKSELFNGDSRFICVYKALKSEDSDTSDASGKNLNSTDSDLVAFVMFRFEWDDEDEPEHPVLFCYEIQVSNAHRAQQIGRHLMDILTKIAKHWRMWKVMLTCFKNNKPAMDFYHKIGFGIDGNSPSSFGHHDEVYEMLSNRPKRPIRK